MLPLSTSANHGAVAIDVDTAIHLGPLDAAHPPADEATPLAFELARTRHAILQTMARDHLALCPLIKRFPGEVQAPGDRDADRVDQLAAYASARLTSTPDDPPAHPRSWGWSTEHDMQAALFVDRAAPQVTEAAVCRALASELLREIGAVGPGAAPAAPGLLTLRAAALQHRLGLRVPEYCALVRDEATGAVRVHSDPSLLGRTIWRVRQPDGHAPDGDTVAIDLPGSPSRQLRVEGQAWVWLVSPDRKQTSVRVGDLALIDQAGRPRTRLSDAARERVALTVIEASPSRDLLDFPAAWVCSPDVAAALLERLDDDAMSQWMARRPLAQRPEIAERVATSCVRAWRHGLVAANADRLGKTMVLKILTQSPETWHDERCLGWACYLGDAERVRAILAGVLGAIDQGLTADEALSILWRKEDRSPPLTMPNGHRCTEAFLDALAPALLDGRLSPEQVTTLLGGGTPEKAGIGLTAVFHNGYCSGARLFLDRLQQFQRQGRLSADQRVRIITGAAEGQRSPGTPFTLRTVTSGSSKDIADWYAEILRLWREQRISVDHGTSLMLGLDRRGMSAWHAAFWRGVGVADEAASPVILPVVRAWGNAIEAGLLPRAALREGLLSRTTDERRSKLGAAAASHDTRWLSALFGRLGELQREGITSQADLLEILDATLDTDGLTQTVADDHPNGDPALHAALRLSDAQQQLTTFERLLNECLRAQVIDGASAARLLLARPDGRTSRSVRTAGLAGGDMAVHESMLNDAIRRGDLSPAQKADALSAARRLADAFYPPDGSPPVAEGG